MAYNPGYVDGTIITSNANYVPGVGLRMVVDDIESGITYWMYLTSDPVSTVLGSGYISDGGAKRMSLGDIVDVFSGTLRSTSATSPQGVALGAVTFPATIGLSSIFSGVPQFQRCIVSAVNATTGAVTLSAIEPNSAALSVAPRNLIQGGDFNTNPWQLGTSFNGTTTAKLTADRWAAIAGSGQTWSAARTANTDVAGFSAAALWGRSGTVTATTGVTFGQVIETQNSIRAQGQPVSLSWYNKAGANFAAGASAGTYRATILAGTGVDDNFTSACSSSWTGASTVAQALFTASTTTGRVNPITGVVPTNATQLAVLFDYQPSAGTTAGANEWLQMIGVQLEIGGMTPFEHADQAVVTDTCYRYLQVVSEPTATVNVGQAAFSASSIAQIMVPLSTPMRTAPTLTFTAGGFCVSDSALGAHTISSAALLGSTVQSLTLNATCAATLTAGLVSYIAGRTTGSGKIIAQADFANA